MSKGIISKLTARTNISKDKIQLNANGDYSQVNFEIHLPLLHRPLVINKKITIFTLKVLVRAKKCQMIYQNNINQNYF